jgi:hypothetical protein
MKLSRYWNRGSYESEFAAFIVVLVIIQVFALPLGWLNAGRTTFWPTSVATMFWIGAGIINLAIYEIATRAAGIVMKPWNPTLVAVLIGGAVLGTPFLEFGKHLYVQAFQSTLVGADLWQPLPSTSPVAVIQRQALNITLWVLINGALVHFHELNRFGFGRCIERGRAAQYESATDQVDVAPAVHIQLARESGSSQPSFIIRIKKPIGPIWAMIAEEHYLRVVGEYGEDLILYRISDAVAEIEGHIVGARVHRSYWTASAAVAHSEKSRSGHTLVLKNGMCIPVSRSYRSAATDAGLLEV